MRTHLLALLIVAVIASAEARAADSPLALSVSIPARDGDHILDQAYTPRFHVILLNISKTPQRVWAPWSELSERTLTFEFTDQTGRVLKVKMKESDPVSHKLPEVCVLEPGESLVFEIDYSNDRVWENFPKAIGGTPGLSIKATYEIRSDPAPEVNRVWTGSVASQPVRITIRPR